MKTDLVYGYIMRVTSPRKAFKWHPAHLSHARRWLKFLQEKRKKWFAIIDQNRQFSFLVSHISSIHRFNSQIRCQAISQTTLTRLFISTSSRLHLYDAEDLVVAQVLSLTVDQEVVELRDPQSQDTQRNVLYSRPVGHDAGCRDGVRDLFLVVGHLLPRPDKQAEIGAIAG